jgi:hypothetical protein
MGAIMHTVLQYIQMSDISDLLDLSSGTGPKLLDEFEERERMENRSIDTLQRSSVVRKRFRALCVAREISRRQTNVGERKYG